MKKKKSDVMYVFVNVLCLVSLIADIELRNYFSHVSDQTYIYPVIMANLAGPLIVCLLIVYRQSHHHKASLLTKIVIDSCSAVAFMVYFFFFFSFSLMPAVAPESLILLCLFIVPAIYNTHKKVTAKAPASDDI